MIWESTATTEGPPASLHAFVGFLNWFATGRLLDRDANQESYSFGLPVADMQRAPAAGPLPPADTVSER